MASLRLKLPLSPPARSPSYSGFHLASSPSAVSDGDSSEDDAPLPFPTALARRDFLAPDFAPASYLSSLFPSGASETTTAAHRHQTLEDLRAELRDCSAAISSELLELVNANYTAFLSLGDELRGGEERVEDVRVALLGFRRAIDEVSSRVRARRGEVDGACETLGGVRGAVELGRRMLELDERVDLLEQRLLVGSLSKTERQDEDGFGVEDSDEDEDEDAYDDEAGSFAASSPAKLSALARDYMYVDRLADSIGRDLPYVKKMEERLLRCRNTILLDLGAATKEARQGGSRCRGRLLKYLGIYRGMDAEAEAVKLLKGR